MELELFQQSTWVIRQGSCGDNCQRAFQSETIRGWSRTDQNNMIRSNLRIIFQSGFHVKMWCLAIIKNSLAVQNSMAKYHVKCQNYRFSSLYMLIEENYRLIYFRCQLYTFTIESLNLINGAC